MDQTGAIAGPLLLAAVLSLHTGNYRLAFGVLIVPGVVVLALLSWLRRRVPDPIAYEMAGGIAAAPEAAAHEAAAYEGTAYEGTSDGEQPSATASREGAGGSATQPETTHARVALPLPLRQYIGAVGLLSLGIASFPLLAFHAQTSGLLTPAQVPVLFALAMLVDGVLDSTVKAVVTDLVGPAGRSIAFGWLALARGLGLLLGGVALGLAYDQGITLVVWLILGVNGVALVVLAWVLAYLSTVET